MKLEIFLEKTDLEVVIYVGMHKDEPMKLEWDSIFINPEKTGTNMKEIREYYPDAEIKFIGNF